MMLVRDPIRTTARLEAALVDEAALVLCDLDGCLVSQNRPFKDAHAFADACGDRLWIVSNNSTQTAGELRCQLARIGLHIDVGRILLAGEQSLHYLSTVHPAARLALFGSESLRQVAVSLGFRLSTKTPDVVYLCRDLAFSVERLNAMALMVIKGAELWVANTDASHPGPDGEPLAETGALLAALQAMVPETPYRSVGKPHPFLVDTALRAAGVPAARAVFVGDNPQTDGAVAAATGIAFLHLNRNGAGR